MNIFPAETFNCLALHPENEFAPADRVRQMILNVAAEHGIAPGECHLLPPSTDQNTYMFCGGFRVLITQSEPLTGRAALERAIDNYPVRKLFPQAERAVAQARMVTTLSIGRGLIPASLVPDHMKEAVSPQTQMIDTLADSQMAMSFLAALVVRFLKLRYATAVNWQQNGYLLPPDVFTSFAQAEDKLSLYIRPHAYVPPQDLPDEDKYVGVLGAGSQYLTGYLIHFVPSTAPLEFMLERLLQFVSLCDLRQAVIPDGDTFGIDPSERIRIHHEKTSPDEPDRINLKLEMSAAFGIIGPKTPMVNLQYGLDGSVVEQTISGVDKDGLDPNDPVDAAILARLAELKAAETSPAPVSPGSARNATAELSNETPSFTAVQPQAAQGQATQGQAAQAYVPPAGRPAPDLTADEGQRASFGTRQRTIPKETQATERLSLEELRRFAQPSPVEDQPKPKASALERLTSFFKGK